MRCEKVRGKIDAYLDNETTDYDEAEIAGHLAVCGHCQRLRKELIFAKSCMRELREFPMAPFTPSVKGVFAPRHASLPLAGILIYTILAICGLALALYFFFGVKGPVRFIQKPVGAIAGDLDFFKRLMPQSRVMLPILPEEKEVRLKTTHPTLVSAGKELWITVEGEATLYRKKDYIQADLISGSLYLVSDKRPSPRIVINAGAFQILSANTAFYVNSAGPNIQIELLSGELLVKGRLRGKAMAVRLPGGEGVSGTSEAERESLRAYRLSLSRKSALNMKIDRIRQIGRWSESHPGRTEFKSGDIRIEFWKGE